MDKARRHELKMLKYKKRIEKYGISHLPAECLYGYRSHGKPCSCSVCAQPKYDRAKERKANFRVLTKEEVEAGRCSAYRYVVGEDPLQSLTDQAQELNMGYND